MHLIKHDIEKYVAAVVGMFCKSVGLTPAELAGGALTDLPALLPRLSPDARQMVPDAVDYYVTLLLAHTAQTFLFDAAQIMEFLRSVDRKLPPGAYAAPFSEMIFQFSQPIPEREFLSGWSSGEDRFTEDDAVLGLVIGIPSEDQGPLV